MLAHRTSIGKHRFSSFPSSSEWHANRANHFTAPQESARKSIPRVYVRDAYLSRCDVKYIETHRRIVAGKLEQRASKEMIDAREKKKTRPLSPARVLMNLSVGMLRSRPLLVRASPMDCQAPRQKLRRNTPTHLPLATPKLPPALRQRHQPAYRVFPSFSTRARLVPFTTP